MKNKKIEYEVGSGNVFAESRSSQCRGTLIKAQLVYKIDTRMKQRKLKQVAVW